jgi:hypothetical protein
MRTSKIRLLKRRSNNSCNACINMNPMISFSLVIVISCPCNRVGNGAVVLGSFAMLIKLEK